MTGSEEKERPTSYVRVYIVAKRKGETDREKWFT